MEALAASLILKRWLLNMKVLRKLVQSVERREDFLKVSFKGWTWLGGLDVKEVYRTSGTQSYLRYLTLPKVGLFSPTTTGAGLLT